MKLYAALGPHFGVRQGINEVNKQQVVDCILKNPFCYGGALFQCN